LHVTAVWHVQLQYSQRRMLLCLLRDLLTGCVVIISCILSIKAHTIILYDVKKIAGLKKRPEMEFSQFEWLTSVIEQKSQVSNQRSHNTDLLTWSNSQINRGRYVKSCV
jgi:hypothetical protein